MTTAQAETLRRILAAGGPVRVTMGRLGKRAVNLRCVRTLMEAGLVEGRIPLDRRQTELFVTTSGVLALVAHEEDLVRDP